MRSRLTISCCLGIILGIALALMPLLPLINRYGDSFDMLNVIKTAQEEGYFDADSLTVLNGLRSISLKIYAITLVFVGCFTGFIAFYISRSRLK